MPCQQSCSSHRQTVSGCSRFSDAPHRVSLFPPGLLTRICTLLILIPPLMSAYIIRIKAITVWSCSMNELMKGGVCWQGGGKEIRGAVRNLLRKGQLRTEQRASERGEFPCSVAFRVSWVCIALLASGLMRKLIGLGMPGLFLIGG